jgi:hypothetical protein
MRVSFPIKVLLINMTNLLKMKVRFASRRLRGGKSMKISSKLRR